MRSWLWHWGPAIAQMTAIFYLSSRTALPQLPGGLSGFSGHAVAYALLGALVLRALAGAKWQHVVGAAAWRALLFSSAYGITDEFHQSFVPNRMPDVMDWLADTAGAAFAVLLVMRIALARRRRARNV